MGLGPRCALQRISLWRATVGSPGQLTNQDLQPHTHLSEYLGGEALVLASAVGGYGDTDILRLGRSPGRSS